VEAKRELKFFKQRLVFEKGGYRKKNCASSKKAPHIN